jgi:hypothetical protein
MRSPTAAEMRAYTLLQRRPPTWWEKHGEHITAGVISGALLAGAMILQWWLAWLLVAVVITYFALSLEQWML